MEHLDPYSFNALRFLLGAIVLFLFIVVRKPNVRHKDTSPSQFLVCGFCAGFFLFGASALQQVGLVTTTAINASFITGLYMVLVPVLGLFVGQKTSRNTWLGSMVGVVGLYLLCIKTGFSINSGDIFVLLGAFLWAAHVLLIGCWVHRVDELRLAALQFFACSIFSLFWALFNSNINIDDILLTKYEILSSGIVCVGLGFTLQIIGQKGANPSHAAVILSLESIFGVLCAVLFLSEVLTLKMFCGCVLIFAGMLLAQHTKVEQKC